jgi:hypothetical protein
LICGSVCDKLIEGVHRGKEIFLDGGEGARLARSDCRQHPCQNLAGWGDGLGADLARHCGPPYPPPANLR